MRTIAFASALAAVVSFAFAASNCDGDIRITQSRQMIDCEEIGGNLIVDSALAGELVIDGPKQLKKDLIIRNNSQLTSVSSDSINSILGTLELFDLSMLSSFKMESLTQVKNVKFVKLPLLDGLTLGTEGVTRSETIVIYDTFFKNVDKFNIVKAKSIDISNNGRLARFKSSLVNVTSLQLTNNNNNMKVMLSNLTLAGDMQFRNVKTVDAPLLSSVGSIKIEDSPQLLSVSANNLTLVQNSLTFNRNMKLGNLSFQALENIKGDMTIQNNTKFKAIDGFPKLKAVGAILLSGSFERVNLPSLDDVRGSARVYSSTDISTFCDFFRKLKSKGSIRGVEKCSSNVKNINEDGSGQSGSNTEKDAAGIFHVNVALLSLALLAGFVQML